jgi:sec-independent protein translocase protein TatA
MGAFGWPHLLIILAVIILIFGAAKLPALAKSVGQSARVFKGEMKAMKEEDTAPATSKTEQSTADDAAKASVDSGKPAEPRS